MHKQVKEAGDRYWLTPTAAVTRSDHALRKVSAERDAPARRMYRYGFRLGPLRLIVGEDVLSEFLGAVAVYGVPGAPNWFKGLSNLRGNLVPVFDLHRFFRYAEVRETNRSIVALDRGSATVCLYVDGLPERVKPDKELQTFPPLPAELKEHVGRVFGADGCVWIEFVHTSFFRALALAISPAAGRRD